MSHVKSFEEMNPEQQFAYLVGQRSRDAEFEKLVKERDKLKAEIFRRGTMATEVAAVQAENDSLRLRNQELEQERDELREANRNLYPKAVNTYIDIARRNREQAERAEVCNQTMREALKRCSEERDKLRARQRCDAESPDGSLLCDLLPGHSGPHVNGETSSEWRQQ